MCLASTRSAGWRSSCDHRSSHASSLWFEDPRLETVVNADASFVEYLKAEEFELTPLPRTEREPGMVAIDGELMPFATTHVSVLPSKLTMLGGAVPPAEDPGAP